LEDGNHDRTVWPDAEAARERARKLLAASVETTDETPRDELLRLLAEYRARLAELVSAEVPSE
jgi:hypothetical protein